MVNTLMWHACPGDMPENLVTVLVKIENGLIVAAKIVNHDWNSVPFETDFFLKRGHSVEMWAHIPNWTHAETLNSGMSPEFKDMPQPLEREPITEDHSSKSKNVVIPAIVPQWVESEYGFLRETDIDRYHSILGLLYDFATDVFKED